MVDKNLKLDDKGLTLIELIVAINITAIILTLVISMFSTGLSIYNTIYDNNEIQQQGHFIMDFITVRILSSDEIDQIIFENKELRQLRLLDSTLKEDEKHIFSIQNDPKTQGRSIRYGKTKDAKIELGNYIKAIYIDPLPKDYTYQDAKGIDITLKLEKGRSDLEISKSIYFRK